ncbi:HD domain-containing protein [Roseiarcus sp.]|uniref:HD domain-containing protein n=1 Tax=Roseiarcus sp. TaxID=1969460 RepID=UPI003F9636A1
MARYHGKLSQSFRGFMLTPIPRGMNWAKLFPRDGEPRYWHPLEDHCIDVAACAETLLNLPIVRTRLAGLAAVAIFPEGWSERLAALAFIHDFGKANRLAKGVNKPRHVRRQTCRRLDNRICGQLPTSRYP